MFAFVKKGEEDFNLKKFTDFVMDRIPPYAVPVFLRLKKVFETTATDKIQKVKLKNEGYNPVEIKDPMYVLLPGSKMYEPLTPEIYERIQKKEYRF
jgi:citronellyl-CoA synthetase